MDPDYVTTLGLPFLAHRLRRLSELFVDGYAAWLPSVGVTAPPRALSTLLMLDERGPAGVTDIARALRLSHPLMIKMVAQLQGRGLVVQAEDPDDGRRRLTRLTDEGRAEVGRIREAVDAIALALQEIGTEIDADLLAAVAAAENAARRESLPERLQRITRQKRLDRCA